MRIAIFCLLLTGCGSACADFVTVYCQLGSSCLGADVAECEATARKFIAAAKYTEQQCSDARDRVVKMTCPLFRAYIEANSR